jgi:hypothetical protein
MSKPTHGLMRTAPNRGSESVIFGIDESGVRVAKMAE